MATSHNGWKNWYAQWNERFGPESVEDVSNMIPYDQLAMWGERFRDLVMLNDHWMGYMHAQPMILEDGMSMAFVLYEAGVEVDELLDLMDEFEPLEGAIVRVGIPLCWLTDPMDHVHDLLGMVQDLPHIDRDVADQMQQTLEEMLGDTPNNLSGDWADIFRSMSINTVQWLLDIVDLMGDHGRLVLRAWWQGRLITLLREAASTPKRRRGGRKKAQPDVPGVFMDLIQSLDLGGIETGAEEDDDAERGV